MLFRGDLFPGRLEEQSSAPVRAVHVGCPPTAGLQSPHSVPSEPDAAGVCCAGYTEEGLFWVHFCITLRNREGIHDVLEERGKSGGEEG